MNIYPFESKSSKKQTKWIERGRE